MEYQTNRITNEQLDKIALASDFSFNSLAILMPYTYLIKFGDINWNDILFAIENGFISHQSAIEHALFELENYDENSQTVIDLACLSPSEASYPHSIHPYIDELANIESKDKKNKTEEKIMYILLNWVFDHKESYDDPLKVVEFIYDDFGFPESIVNFVRYMPTNQPLLDTLEANIERLYDNWKKFLDIQKLRY